MARSPLQMYVDPQLFLFRNTFLLLRCALYSDVEFFYILVTINNNPVWFSALASYLWHPVGFVQDDSAFRPTWVRQDHLVAGIGWKA